MCKYKVIKKFTDLYDDCHEYNVGDEYPRHGVSVNEVRIAQLSSKNNRQNTPLIIKEEGLDSATSTPAQPTEVEQEIPKEEVAEEVVEEKAGDVQPKKRKRKDD